MAEIQDPSFLQAGCTTAQGDRQAFSSLVCGEGVAPDVGGELEVTERGAGANMSVDVASGNAFIDGTEAGYQGMYHVPNDATVNIVIAAADPTDDRIDLIVATVRDATYSGVSNDWLLQRVAGTASPAPVAPALPDNSLLLATVLVQAAVVTIVNADITDERVSYEMCSGAPTSWVTNALGAVSVADNTSQTVPQSDDGTHSADWSLAANQWTYNGTASILAQVSVFGGWLDMVNINGIVQIALEVNAVIVVAQSDTVDGPAISGFYDSASGAVVIAPGDALRVRVFQNSTGAQDFSSGRMSVVEVARV